MITKEIVVKIVDFLRNNACKNVVLFDVKNGVCNIVASTDSCALNEDVYKKLIENFGNDITLLHIDGEVLCDWVVLDFDFVVIHICTEKIREKFNLDKLFC